MGAYGGPSFRINSNTMKHSFELINEALSESWTLFVVEVDRNAKVITSG